MKRKLSMVAIACLALATSVASAGTWHKGEGKTIKEATDRATAQAEAAVRKRGKGCVDGIKKPVKVGDKWVVEVHRSHHRGSC